MWYCCCLVVMFSMSAVIGLFDCVYKCLKNVLTHDGNNARECIFRHFPFWFGSVILKCTPLVSWLFMIFSSFLARLVDFWLIFFLEDYELSFCGFAWKGWTLFALDFERIIFLDEFSLKWLQCWFFKRAKLQWKSIGYSRFWKIRIYFLELPWSSNVLL